MNTIQELREQLAKTIGDLHGRRWCEGTGGNFSVVVQDDPIHLLMAPSGVNKGRLEPAELVVVDEQNNVIEGRGRASAETTLHLEIIRQLKSGAVLHTHSIEATVLSDHYARIGKIQLEGWEMLKGLKELHPMKHQSTYQSCLTTKTSKNSARRLGRISVKPFQESWSQAMAFMLGVIH